MDLHILLAITPLAPYEIFLIVLGVVLGLAVLWTLFSLLIGIKTLQMASKPRAHTLEEARKFQQEVEHLDFTDYDNNWKKQSFEIDGLHGKLRGEVVFNPAKTNKVAIICHGHTWNRINSVKYGDAFYRKGYNLVLYDHSYFGLSDGKFCTLGFYEKHDLSKVIDYARSVFGKDAFIALHGESMGAVTVLSVLGIRSDVDLVVADCPFADTFTYYREIFRRIFHVSPFPSVEFSALLAKCKYGYKFNEASPINDVKGSNVPICFIHGKDDKFIYPHHSVDMYDVSNNKLSELNLVAGAGHAGSFLADNDGYRKIISDFTEKVEKANKEKSQKDSETTTTTV